MSTNTVVTTWKLDATHSEVEFRVKHLMINNVKGRFRNFDVQVESDGDEFNSPKISFTAETASIDTGNEQRDQHLRSAEFFNSEEYPQIIFEGREYAGNKLHGNLILHGVTKPITLDVEFGGVAKDPWGNKKAGFTISGKINRKDFGLTWNAALETGGVLVSEEVKIQAEIQLIQS
ncbi:MAG TPA: YceI family protein [Cytophagaceae bacterium]|jgi:polyisoprenoid-binding protein YceI